MTDRENDFNRTAQDGEGRQVQQELERQLRELGDTMSDSFRHGFEGRGEEIGDRVWDVGRAAVNAAGYGISEAGRAFQAGKQEYQKRAEEARSSAGASGMTDWARNFFAKKPEPTAIENIRTSAKSATVQARHCWRPASPSPSSSASRPSPASARRGRSRPAA